MNIETEGNWSRVGTDAEMVKRDKPTMVLNLKDYHPVLQQSLVIHEFGHALGLEHEHRRSDFWEILGVHIDTEKMMSDPLVNPPESGEEKVAFARDWGKKIRAQITAANKPKSSEYDPESIMHYW